MRYGVLSDVHGNLHALEAVLAVLRQEGVDRYLCLGDLVGFGPFPNECVRRVAELDALCIAGNHELIALERLSEARCGRLARESLAWTREVLDSDVRRYLGALPLLAAPGDGIVMAHGTLDDPERYVRTSERAQQQLDRLEQEHPSARVLLVGHTHRPMLHPGPPDGVSLRQATPLRSDRVLVNPGSVGQSRDRSPDARAAVLDVDSAGVTFHAVRYDVAACRRALRVRGRPANSCHPRQPPMKVAARQARRLLESARRRTG